VPTGSPAPVSCHQNLADRAAICNLAIVRLDFPDEISVQDDQPSSQRKPEIDPKAASCGQ
jgi:hypothetical protein